MSSSSALYKPIAFTILYIHSQHVGQFQGAKIHESMNLVIYFRTHARHAVATSSNVEAETASSACIARNTARTASNSLCASPDEISSSSKIRSTFVSNPSGVAVIQRSAYGPALPLTWISTPARDPELQHSGPPEYDKRSRASPLAYLRIDAE